MKYTIPILLLLASTVLGQDLDFSMSPKLTEATPVSLTLDSGDETVELEIRIKGRKKKAIALSSPRQVSAPPAVSSSGGNSTGTKVVSSSLLSSAPRPFSTSSGSSNGSRLSSSYSMSPRPFSSSNGSSNGSFSSYSTPAVSSGGNSTGTSIAAFSRSNTSIWTPTPVSLPVATFNASQQVVQKPYYPQSSVAVSLSSQPARVASTRRTVPYAGVYPNTRSAWVQHVQEHGVPASVARSASMSDLVRFHSNAHAGLPYNANTTVGQALQNPMMSSAPMAAIRQNRPQIVARPARTFRSVFSQFSRQ